MPAESETTDKKQIDKPWLFKPGQSGNPKGRPLGSVSIRDSIRRYLEDNPEEVNKLVQHFVKNKPEFMWQMVEGAPKQEHELSGPNGAPLGEPSDAVKALTEKLNAIHGGASVGSDGVPAVTLDNQAPNQN